ncbi:serine protease [Pontibacillus salicampi]|uniref:Serine protease n=1 Tax=Pontibacillus salicampi TaxID=1449801 RepID=A0ABV6LKN7_9BACI
MKAQDITEEIAQLKIHINALEKQLHQLQEECEHEYIPSAHHEQCMKCHKVNTLYY